MIQESKDPLSPKLPQGAPKGSIVQITDYNFQTIDKRTPSQSLLDRAIDSEHLNHNSVRAQVQKIMSQNNSSEHFTYHVGGQELAVNPEIQMTVKNENLFSMMQESISRTQKQKKEQQEKEKASNMNLSKMMGKLQTFKDK